MNEIVKLGPEHYDIANGFLLYGTIQDTAEQMQVPQYEVVKILQMPEVKRYLDGIYLDQGYRNRDKMGKILDKIIDSKLEEAEESGVYTGKDLLDVIALVHKMRMDEIKASKENNTTVGTAVQINNQFGDSNYGKLMERLTSK